MRLRRVIAALAAIVALVAALAGCVKSDDSPQEVINDPSNAKVDLPDNPRVVALGWSDGAIALELGVKPVAIYDWMAFGDATKGVGQWDADKFGTDSPKLLNAATGNFDYNEIRELKPDIILNVRAKNDTGVTDKLKEIAPVVIAPDGSGDFAVNWKTQTQLIGAALGKSDEATKLISETEAVSTKLKSENPGFAGKTFTFGAKFGTAYGAYLAGDARFDVFADLGFKQNPAVESLDKSGFFANVPVEKVTALDADVSILSEIGFSLADVQNDQRLNTLAVVRDGRAVTLAGKDPAIEALGAGTPASLKFALEQIVPKLAAAAAKVK